MQTFLVEGEEERLFPVEVAERVPHMLRTLDIIWSCLFVFGACSISTYELEEDVDGASDDSSTARSARPSRQTR